MENGGVLARWTTDFDCGYETEWWYCIKDTPFDISSIKAKRRYEINKGNKNFDVKEIDVADYLEELYQISLAAYSTYPEYYRPNIEHDTFVEDVRSWNDYKNYGAFFKEDGTLCGFVRLRRKGYYIDFTALKATPNKEKLAINAALVHKILVDHDDLLKTSGYICDGSRSIQHETAFQDYLEKYFEFRKAYCTLHIMYKPPFNCLINLAYPFRNLIEKFSERSSVRKINSLFKMETIARSFK